MSPTQGRQIFQTASGSRWQRFKWSSRLAMVFALLALGVIIVTLVTGYMPSVPRLKEQGIQYKRTLDSGKNLIYQNSLIAQKYRGFRQYITDKTAHINNNLYFLKNNRVRNLQEVPPAAPLDTTLPCAIRSAFYVAWDPQSFFSLQRNISKLNLVIPEWMFIDPRSDTLFTSVDDRAFEVMKKAGVRIMPILSNNFKEQFRGDAVHRIIHDPVKKARLINDVMAILEKNHFAGVNVDFEELQERSDEPFIQFQKELYEKLHAKGFLVTQDVIPFNDDYNFNELAKYNDYIFLMAYDEFSNGTAPGPIADQKWIEAAVDAAAKKLPSKKIILGLGAYGYDWPKGDSALDVPLTYQQALLTAKESEGKIDFDNDSYNLHYVYYDDNDIEHDVYFTDAATIFNTMRFATEYGLAGVGLWRLGSEDSRMWDFYNLDMRKDAIKNFDFERFTTVKSTDDVDYLPGDGEVLDIRATPTDGKITPELDTSELLISEERYDSLPSMFIVQKYGGDTARNKKKLVLTFDDGPDPTFTPEVLDILGKKHVPASFFLVGLNAENNIPLVKRMYREGHEIGNHTFTHPNVAEISHRRAVLEMEATRLLIECITGHSTILFRAPYNADFQPEKMEELLPVAIARSKNYLDVGESIDPEDWEPGVSADSIFQRVVRRKAELEASGFNGNIILLHDAGGNTRKATVQALPKIIDYFQARGYQFTTIADLLQKKKDELMPPVPKGSGYYLVELNYALAEFGYWGSHFLFSLFVVFILLSISRILFMGWLAWKESKKKAGIVFNGIKEYPLVSIIVPAYNEEVNAVASMRNLLRTDYPNYNVIFVDDGSKDSTYEIVKNAFKDEQKVRVYTKTNGGKASALNFGIAQSDAEFVVCIDADTKLKPDAVSHLMKHFLVSTEYCDKQSVGAVAGNVKVGNTVNLLTRWQSIEYITSQNFDRMAFSYLNAITVVPGAIGAFRKQAIKDSGGFTVDTLAEDCDLTIRILRAGYVVANESKAIAYTEAPETLKMFIKQRFRWSFGVMQTFWKHRDTLFNSRYASLGWVAMPSTLIFQYIIPSVIPLADLFMLIGILTGNAAKILLYYLLFIIIDLFVALIAFRFEKERVGRLIWLIPQRLIYRWLMWYVLFKAVRRAIKGELQNWGVLKRTGHVQDVELKPVKSAG
jgi:cellulose synthase/poly-beta-1,6-N-acetylglucosamine synthase-like glycosyltransferase/spore germination protein YaaH/peptidoglycan/xylan/chitin deacetylase (PgdA/CDA1 family)